MAYWGFSSTLRPNTCYIDLNVWYLASICPVLGNLLIQLFTEFFFFCVFTVFPLEVIYLEYMQLAFDCIVIACSLESIRPGLVQGCKAPDGVGSTCLITSSESGLPQWTWSVCLNSAFARTQTRNHTIGPSQAIPSLLIGIVLSPRTDMCGAVTNTGYYGMPTSLGIVQMLIHCLGRGSMADNPHTSQYPSMSVADITDCATSPAKILLYVLGALGSFYLVCWVLLFSLFPSNTVYKIHMVKFNLIFCLNF